MLILDQTTDNSVNYQLQDRPDFPAAFGGVATGVSGILVSLQTSCAPTGEPGRLLQAAEAPTGTGNQAEPPRR